ncbi:Ribosomal large subunit pseudouridine synthase D [Azospirillaceae bacterium]
MSNNGVNPAEDAPDDEDEDVGSRGEQSLDSETRRFMVTISADIENQRLDKALSTAVEGLSRSRIQALMAQGCVRCESRVITDLARAVKRGQTFEIEIPIPIDATPRPQAMPLDIVYEDDSVIVINKPAGLVAHPAPGHADFTLVNGLLAHCGDRLSGIGGVRRPGIVHRLDKETSGLMVVAKTDQAHIGLCSQFADRSLSREYFAVTWGLPTPTQGEIVGAIGRHPIDRKRMAIVQKGGKEAKTFYQNVQNFGVTATLVRCRLATGRTHQIRVHLTSIGHPLIGDNLYGADTRRVARLKASLTEPLRSRIIGFSRQALHAFSLRFLHPATGKSMLFESRLPDDVTSLIHHLEQI